MHLSLISRHEFEDFRSHAHGTETTIVIQILHSHAACKIAKQSQTIICTSLSTGIAQRRHFIGIIKEVSKSFNSGSCCCFGGRLRNGIYPDFSLLCPMVTETSSEGFQKRL